ncbi:MAG: hypothetical protein U1A73_13220 [Pseudomonas sp.]|nr:hypothetical protein [Pseudomonas sp.]
MNFLLATALFATPLLGFAATSLPACHETATAPLSFRSEQSRDTIEVTIRGAPCHAAMLSVRITSDAGKVLYSYDAPFKMHVAIHWEDPELPKRAAEFASRIAAQDEKETTSDLPPWQLENDYYEEHFNLIKVSKEQYEQLRSQERPIFTHPTHYEQWQSVIYEPETGLARILLEGGL